MVKLLYENDVVFTLVLYVSRIHYISFYNLLSILRKTLERKPSKLLMRPFVQQYKKNKNKINSE